MPRRNTLAIALFMALPICGCDSVKSESQQMAQSAKTAIQEHAARSKEQTEAEAQDKALQQVNPYFQQLEESYAKEHARIQDGLKSGSPRDQDALGEQKDSLNAKTFAAFARGQNGRIDRLVCIMMSSTDCYTRLGIRVVFDYAIPDLVPGKKLYMGDIVAVSGTPGDVDEDAARWHKVAFTEVAAIQVLRQAQAEVTLVSAEMPLFGVQ